MSQIACLNLSLLHSGTYLEADNAKQNGFQKFQIGPSNIFESKYSFSFQEFFRS